MVNPTVSNSTAITIKLYRLNNTTQTSSINVDYTFTNITDDIITGHYNETRDVMLY